MAELIIGKQESKQWVGGQIIYLKFGNQESCENQEIQAQSKWHWVGGQIKHLEIWKSRNLGTVAVGWWTELWRPVAVHLAPDGCDF